MHARTRRYTKAKSLVAAAANVISDGSASGGSGLNGEDVSEKLGLVAGHAYAPAHILYSRPPTYFDCMTRGSILAISRPVACLLLEWMCC